MSTVVTSEKRSGISLVSSTGDGVPVEPTNVPNVININSYKKSENERSFKTIIEEIVLNDIENRGPICRALEKRFMKRIMY